MKKGSVLLIMLTLLILWNFSVTAESLYELHIETVIRTQLLEGNIITRDSYTNPGPPLCPTDKWVSIDQDKYADDKGFFAETLSLVPYPGSWDEFSPDEKMISIINTLRAVSTQEGITYISHRRGDKPAILIRTSHVVDKLGSRQRLPDPVIRLGNAESNPGDMVDYRDAVPVKITDIVFQSDTSFSGNFYQYSYTIGNEMVFVSVKNLSPLSVFGLIPVVPKEQYTASVVVSMVEEGILVYSFAEIADRQPEVSILGYKVHLPDAINRRWIAVHEWFRAQVLGME